MSSIDGNGSCAIALHELQTVTPRQPQNIKLSLAFEVSFFIEWHCCHCFKKVKLTSLSMCRLNILSSFHPTFALQINIVIVEIETVSNQT